MGRVWLKLNLFEEEKKSAVQLLTCGNCIYIITIRWTIRIRNGHSTWVNIDSFRLNLHTVLRCETFFLISSLKKSSIFTLDSPKLPWIKRNAWIAWTYGRLSLAVIENKLASSKRFTNIFINFHHLIFKAFQQITTIPSFLVYSSLTFSNLDRNFNLQLNIDQMVLHALNKFRIFFIDQDFVDSSKVFLFQFCKSTFLWKCFFGSFFICD